MEEKRSWKRWRKAAVAGVSVVVVLLVLMGIGLALREKDDSGVSRPFPGVTEVEEAAVTPGGQPSAGDAERKSLARERAAPGAADAPVTARAVQGYLPPLAPKTIKTGSLTIEIEKGAFNREYGAVTLLAERVGGYVSDSRSNSDGSRITGGTITIRVPGESYSKVVEELKGIGKVTAISEESQDVTDEYVDIESRVNNLRAQEAVYLRLMSEAETVEQSIAVQRELAVVQEQIEQLTGRRNYLDSHVQFSSIQVNLVEPGAGTGGGQGWGFTQALSDAAHGVVDGLNAVIRFLGEALVYIMIIAGAGLAVLYLVRFARRRRKPAPPGASGDE